MNPNLGGELRKPFAHSAAMSMAAYILESQPDYPTPRSTRDDRLFNYAFDRQEKYRQAHNYDFIEGLSGVVVCASRVALLEVSRVQGFGGELPPKDQRLVLPPRFDELPSLVIEPAIKYYR